MRIKKNKRNYLSQLDDVDLTSCVNCLVSNLNNLTECVSQCPKTAIELMEEKDRNSRMETPPGNPDLRLIG